MILGIDPGLGGALAWLNADGTLNEILDMPVLAGEVSAEGLFALDPAASMAVIEWPGLMPANGAKAARSIGMSLATIHTWLVANHTPTTRVSPGTWKRALGLSADKDQSRAMAERLWPPCSWLFKRKKDADRAEAALVAYWWLTKGAGASREAS